MLTRLYTKDNSLRQTEARFEITHRKPTNLTQRNTCPAHHTKKEIWLTYNYNTSNQQFVFLKFCIS
jgi:hypothetical protein